MRVRRLEMNIEKAKACRKWLSSKETPLSVRDCIFSMKVTMSI